MPQPGERTDSAEIVAKIYSRITGTGSYLPRRVLTNAELATTTDTSDAWIRARTGIVERHIAEAEETTTEMAVNAATAALKAAGVKANELDLIVVATITPDLIFPSTGALLQHRLGARTVGAMDLSAACSGFLYALALVDAMIGSGKCSTALIVGSERMSHLLDWSERATCVLFGDGAGAAVLVSDSSPGVRSVHLHADGSTPDVLRTPSKQSPYLHMEGGTVFKFAVRGLVESGVECLKANHMSPRDVTWLIPHQANLRIIEASARKLEIARDRLIVTVDKHANTSAASIPLALDSGVRRGLIKAGDEVLLLSVGGGFTWASCLMRW